MHLLGLVFCVFFAVGVGCGGGRSGGGNGQLPTAAAPTFSPAPGSYSRGVNVTLSDTTAGAVIHCTTDGTTPSPSSPTCTTLNLKATTTIQAFAVASGFNNSSLASATYTVTTDPGTPPGSYTITVTATSSGLTQNGTVMVTV
jgi:hypothetical protein